jgi:pilus assembly protein CpaE
MPNNYDAAAASVNQGVPVLQLAPASPSPGRCRNLRAKLGGEAAPAAQQSGGWPLAAPRLMRPAEKAS